MILHWKIAFTSLKYSFHSNPNSRCFVFVHFQSHKAPNLPPLHVSETGYVANKRSCMGEHAHIITPENCAISFLHKQTPWKQMTQQNSLMKIFRCEWTMKCAPKKGTDPCLLEGTGIDVTACKHAGIKIILPVTQDVTAVGLWAVTT